MKPLNLDNKPCSPISSNCVIWQGPDIPCIKLCTGDTVSDIVAKLATELCTVLDILNVTNYDLSCFNLTACGPNDFQALIQFLIERICALQTEVTVIVDPATSPINTTKSTGAETLVTVADCFVISGVTVMTVSQYAQAIGVKVCSLIDQIAVIQNQVNNLEIRVTALEAVPAPTFTLPSFEVNCTLDDGVIVGGNTYQIDQILEALVNDSKYGYCALLSSTGLPSNLLAAVASQCISNTDDSLANSGQTMSTAYFGTWVDSPVTVADAITNLWISICDVRDYVETLALSVANTSTVNLNSTGNVITANITDTGWVDLRGFAYYSGVTKPQCRRIGNQIHFRGVVVVPLENPLSPGNVIVYNSATAYNGVGGCTVWTGTGGCTVGASFEGLQFNNGASVIPTSITTGVLDSAYYADRILVRQININGTFGTALSSVTELSISANGSLELGTIRDREASPIRTGAFGSAALRFINSDIRSGEYVPNYIAAGSDIDNAPSNANFPLVSDTFNLTWPFSCDASASNQIGGFEFKLDGLVAYLDPCNTETGFSTTCP
jgi:hypothetical protein